MQKITRSFVATNLPVRDTNAHKGTNGRVLVVAGSRRMCGAGLLCAKSALRAGAGLIYWALPQTMQPSFAAACPDVITIPLPETKLGEISAKSLTILQKFITQTKPTLAVIGMGMQNSPLLPLFLHTIQLPILLDADALNTLSKLSKFSFKQPVILTPHPGEIARLLHEEVQTTTQGRLEQVSKLAEQTASVCVLKGHDTLVALSTKSKTILWQNTTGNSALAKGGSGDVLSGVIAGLWAQLGVKKITLENALQATLCGVYVHGLAGDLAQKELSTYGVLPSDTSIFVAHALKELEDKK